MQTFVWIEKKFNDNDRNPPELQRSDLTKKQNKTKQNGKKGRRKYEQALTLNKRCKSSNKQGKRDHKAGFVRQKTWTTEQTFQKLFFKAFQNSLGAKKVKIPFCSKNLKFSLHNSQFQKIKAYAKRTPT